MAVIQSLATPSPVLDERATESKFLKPLRRARPQMSIQTHVDAHYPRAQSPEEPLMGTSTTTSRPGFLGFFGRSFSSGKTLKRNAPLSGSESDDLPTTDIPHTDNETTPFIPKRSLTDEHISWREPRPSLSNVGPRRPSRTWAARTHSPQFDNIASPWDPPPLFEAYPQAVKHAYLPVPTLPIEEILRRHQYECYSRTKQEIITGSATASFINDDAPPSPEKARLEQALFISKSEWTHKIFVLVKSGQLLQYAAKGSYDRRPEKVLPLEKNSAVFASDAIPGKPWVLQVSHRSDAADFGATETGSSLFRKLSLKGSPPTRKPVGNLLLILYGADEMECWISTIRKQIEDLGGNPAATEARVREQIAEVHGVSSRPSIDSSLTLMDSERISNLNGLGLYSPGISDHGRHNKPPRPSYESHTPEPAEPRSFFRPPSDAGSASTGTHSDDQTQLDRLREDFDASSTSRGTSLASTPVREDFSQSGQTTHCKQLSIDSYTSNMVRSESADSQRIVPDERISHDHPRPPFLCSRTRSMSDRTVYTTTVPRQSPRLGSKYVPTCPSPLSPIPPNFLPGSPRHGGWPTGHTKTSSISSMASTCVTGYFDVIDPTDPTAEITASIYNLLNSSPPMDVISEFRQRRSSSAQRRPRRPSAGVRSRTYSGSQPRSAPGSPPIGLEIDPLATYRPKPLRINKRTSSVSSVASGPPPAPPPACPLPAVPPEPVALNLWTGDHRAAELRKQSWKVTRAYHPLRVDVV
ncbi:MAG: hypothetical protein M1816_006322 [Peltula sp. TS41687]|nr:MAG: hypothetical protein M1816_006322 [Peltula sp. TS41687]